MLNEWCSRILILIVVLCTVSSQFVAAEQANRRAQFDIPAQAVATALIIYSEQAAVQVIVASDTVDRQISATVAGDLDVVSALEILLEPAGLVFEFTGPNTVTIMAATTQLSRPQAGSAAVSTEPPATADPVAEQSASDGISGVIEEILVTAQKRTQSLQQTPISVMAYTADDLQQGVMEDLYDIGLHTPGLIVNKEIVGKIYIRGIGAENLTIGGDPGVAVHIDGAYVARNSAAIFDLQDIERVEVLRGPQGTLYGRNATGGSINIISKKPTEEFYGRFGAEFGEYDRSRYSATVSGPLIRNRLLARATLMKSDRDGFVRNLTTGSKLDDEDLLVGRVSLTFLPTDSVTIDVSTDFSHDDGRPAPFKQLEFSDLFEGVLGAVDPAGLRRVAQESPVLEEQDQFGVAASLVWEMENMIFTSVTSYRDTEFEAVFDGDAVDITFQNFANFDDSDQFSQEFRLASVAGGRWDWLVGLYYFTDDADTSISIPIPGFGFDILHIADMSTDAYAVFSDVTYRVSEQFHLTVGLRYSSEEKEADQFSDFGFIPPLSQGLKEESDEFTPKFGASYFINDRAMLYASATRGFKSGGFTFNGFQSSFDPEFVWAYEVGLKSRWADSRLQVNVSAFYYDYTDLQVSKLENNAGVIVNAADATISGAELQIDAQPTERWSLYAGFSFLDATFDKFLTEDPSNPLLGTINLDGNNLTRSPEFTANIGTQYVLPLGGRGELSFRVDYQYQDESFFTAFNRQLSAQDSFELVNARIAYADEQKRWQIAAYVKNATDEDYFINILESGVETGKPEGFVAPPRTFGIQLAYTFR